MEISYNYLALKINHLSKTLDSTFKVFRSEHKIRGQSILSYRFTDKNNKRHEHYASNPKGQNLARLYSLREEAASELEKWQSVWKSTYAHPVPRLDLPALRASKTTIITKEFFDSLIPCSNPKPILRPNPYKGITFRSKSEREIAEILDELGIEYKYEPAIPVNDYEIHADFVCFIRELGIGFIIEHCGLMDSTTYIEKTIRTFRDYLSLGLLPTVDVLFTYEKNATPPSNAYFRTQINRLLDTLCAF